MQLDLFAPKTTASESSENLAKIIDILDRDKGWLSAVSILARMGCSVTENDRRFLRGLIATTPRVISGQNGYRHIAHATTEEVHHFVALMRSQADKMTARALEVSKLAHARLG